MGYRDKKSAENTLMVKQFMVEFQLPPVLTEDFIRLIPRQREYVTFLLAEGKLKSYSLSMDRSRLWAVFSARNEFEVLEAIAQFPLADYMTPKIMELAFHNAQDMVLQFSMN
jgi:muconolactone delta-isomerase